MLRYRELVLNNLSSSGLVVDFIFLEGRFEWRGTGACAKCQLEFAGRTFISSKFSLQIVRLQENIVNRLIATNIQRLLYSSQLINQVPRKEKEGKGEGPFCHGARDASTPPTHNAHVIFTICTPWSV